MRETRSSSALPGFTLLEVTVGTVVLALLTLLIGQLFNGASAVSGLGTRRMDADTQARAVIDRMTIDFAQMIRRPDVDYFLKDGVNRFPGNDIMAFYSQVPGYYSSSSSNQQSPLSVAGYRVNADPASAVSGQLERFGRGLLWNGTASAEAPLVFSAVSRSSGANNKLVLNWPAATSALLPDTSYDVIGPQVFRFEYFYLLKGRADTSPALPTLLSSLPWDVRPEVAHTSVEGLQDVAAVVVVFAVIDAKSRTLLNDAQLQTIAAGLSDFDPAAGSPEKQWREKVAEPAPGIPPVALSAIRVYSRCFYLASDSN